MICRSVKLVIESSNPFPSTKNDARTVMYTMKMGMMVDEGYPGSSSFVQDNLFALQLQRDLKDDPQAVKARLEALRQKVL